MVNALAFITVFSVMTSIGTSPSLLIRGLISVLVIVPAIGFATTFAFDLSLLEQVGVVLMAIAPRCATRSRDAMAVGRQVALAQLLPLALGAVVKRWLLSEGHGSASPSDVLAPSCCSQQ